MSYLQRLTYFIQELCGFMVKSPTSRQRSAHSKSQEEAQKIARATQRPGQTKEQTKLIAQGIQKGIDEYKKQQKVKARELDKSLKKVKSQLANELPREPVSQAPADVRDIVHRPRYVWLPWGLLGISWLGFVIWYVTQHSAV